MARMMAKISTILITDQSYTHPATRLGGIMNAGCPSLPCRLRLKSDRVTHRNPVTYDPQTYRFLFESKPLRNGYCFFEFYMFGG